MQMGTWGKWALANSRHVGRLAAGQISFEANRHWGKWELKQRALGVIGHWEKVAPGHMNV